MFIDKVSPYWTEADRNRIKEINSKQAELLKISRAKKNEEEITAIFSEIGRLNEELMAINNEVEARYINSHSKRAILADIAEIVEATEKEDFLSFIKEALLSISALSEKGTADYVFDPIREIIKENYENCCRFILSSLRVQLTALGNDEKSQKQVRAIIEKRVSLWYVKTQPAYLPMAHGKATDAFAFMTTRNAEIDSITGDATLEKLGVHLVILKLKEKALTLGINADKLLSTAIATFTQNNDFRHTVGKEPKREVVIPLKRYAKSLNYDVEEHPTNTPEEAERERKRAKNALDNARKAIKKDLLLLQAVTLRWEENIKGKPKDFDSISLVTRVSIQNGDIRIAFTPEIASYLAERNLITQYPTALLKLDSRKSTAYYVGRKLAEHYHIDNNQVYGTKDRISIPALLSVTDLPSYEEVQKKDRGHWAERIKEPLERALDTLTQEGILENWEYTHAKGIPLTDEEAGAIIRYEDFAKLYLHFALAETAESPERIQKKQEARAKAIARAKAKKKKKKTDKENS